MSHDIYKKSKQGGIRQSFTQQNSRYTVAIIFYKSCKQLEHLHRYTINKERFAGLNIRGFRGF